MSTLRITKKTFTFEDFSPLLNGPLKVVLDQSIPKKVKNSYQQLLKILASGKIVYGVNTGFGKLSNIRIDEADQEKLQLNLVRSHSAGLGGFLDIGIVRVVMALKVLTYAYIY